jgi:hypothetical protein
METVVQDVEAILIELADGDEDERTGDDVEGSVEEATETSTD